MSAHDEDAESTSYRSPIYSIYSESDDQARSASPEPVFDGAELDLSSASDDDHKEDEETRPGGRGEEQGEMNEVQTDALIGKLQAAYQLKGRCLELAIKAAQCPPRERHAYTIFSLLATHQSLNANSSFPSTPFFYNDRFKEFIQERGRLTIVTADLEAYTSTTDRYGRLMSRSLVALTRDLVDRQPIELKQRALPPGYLDDHPAAITSLRKFLNVLLGHVRAQFRSLLLTNIIENKKIQIDGPVPSAVELIIKVSKYLHNSKSDRQPKELTVPMLIRMSHLRLQTASHHLGHYPEHISQWSLIDERLEILRHKSTSFQDKHAELVLAKDAELFAHARFFREISPEPVVMPSLQDVTDAMTHDQPSLIVPM